MFMNIRLPVFIPEVYLTPVLNIHTLIYFLLFFSYLLDIYIQRSAASLRKELHCFQ